MKLSIIHGLVVGLWAGLVQCQATGTIDEGPFPEDLNGSNFTYPYPVKLFRFASQLQDLEMAFVDVAPSNQSHANGDTVVLLHGKNFCAATWGETIDALARAGYRIVAPDQIGFCKSSKPLQYQFSFHQLSWNTRGLLNTLGIEKATVLGHSMGGMVATRFGLLYPDYVEKLVLVNSLGLEDYIAKGVPYIGIEQSVATEARSNYTSTKAYQQKYYYVDTWDPKYDVWVNMSVNIYYGSQRDAFVKGQARVVDMVLTQPVAPHFKDLQPQTLILNGKKDKTAIGSAWAPPDVLEKIGRYDLLGSEVVSQLPNGDLIEFEELGHAPQISHPLEFQEALIGWLAG